MDKLLIQGEFLKLLESEQSNVIWKSIIFGVHNGAMAFAMRSATNTVLLGMAVCDLVTIILPAPW